MALGDWGDTAEKLGDGKRHTALIQLNGVIESTGEDIELVTACHDACNRYGVDAVSSSATIGWVCEAVEKGVLSAADLDGIDMRWGDGEAALALTIKIGTGDGCGAWHGHGVARAAAHVGKGSEEFAVHVHGGEPAYHESRFTSLMGVTYIADPTPGRHTAGSASWNETFGAGFTLPRAADKKDWNVKWKGTAGKGKAQALFSNAHQAMNGLGLCMFTMLTGPLPWADLLEAATGWGLSEADLLTCGERIQNLRAAFNRLEGLGPKGLQRGGWYLVLSNHQSWVDILVLQKLFNRRIPMLKIFLKRELIWVPVIGLAWWALDFPFMRRQGGASSAQDLERARKACEKFRVVPTSVINFLEGTRYTRAKHDAQGSRYAHLLKPKVGGIATALTTLGEQFRHLLDVTIVYPDGPPDFWTLLSGQLRARCACSRARFPPELLAGDYASDPTFRARMQDRINRLWSEKDAQIGALRMRPAG